MNRYLEKIAKQAPEKEKPHVERALAKLEKEKGVLIDHSVGSGKTRLFLKAVERAQAKNKDPNARSLIVAPASLVSNIEKEVTKHGLKVDLSKVDAVSYEKAVIDADKLRKNRYLIAVADEAHKLKDNSTKRHRELSDIFMDSDQRLLASATPAQNHVSDIGTLVNLAAGRRVLPEGKREFEEEYVNTGPEPMPLLKRILGGKPQEKHTLKNTKELSKILNQYIDHYNLQDDPEAAKHFPSVDHEIIKVPMSSAQMGVYKYYENELPWHLKLKVRSGLAMDRRDVAALQLYSQGIRQVSNSARSFMPNYQEVSPKIQHIADSVAHEHKKDKRYKGIIYSNYKNAGIGEISEQLTARGIEHSVFHGGLNRKQKDEILDKYNSSDKHVLLLTSSGAEGLNTKGTKHVIITEPFFHKARVDQVVGRASRYKSHDHLPQEERKVKVQHFISTFPDSPFGTAKSHAIDEYLHHNSKTKDEVSQQLRGLMKQ